MKKVVLLIGLLIGGFAIAGSVLAAPGDAIGIRVLPNPEKMAPDTWYKLNVPNPGVPTFLEVDGYAAVREGRTVYISAVNYDQDAQKLWPNIYLISYSETPREDVAQVFEAFLRDFHLNTNVDKLIAAQMRRDMRRANDIHSMKLRLEKYKEATGVYPTFEAGSYLPNTSYSTWPSWQSVLGNMLGSALPIDPRNQFIGCTDPYDAKTCWNVTDRQFACPPEAYVYGYRSVQEGGSYSFFTNYEYSGPGNWQGQSFLQQTSDQCFNFITADSADIDGDGVFNTVDNCPNHSNGPGQEDADNDGLGDVCDICPNDPTNDQDNDGVCGNLDSCPTISNPNQSDSDGDGAGDVCDYQTCGNNIAEGTEICDGQSGLNEYQQCAPDCRSISQQSFCGDGIVDAPNDQGIVEECDGNEEINVCDDINQYKAQRTRVCRDTCRFAPYTECTPIEFIGDGIVNGAEECDAGDQNGVQCVAGYGQTCQYCNSKGKFEVAEGPKCGDGVVQDDPSNPKHDPNSNDSLIPSEQCDKGVNNGLRCEPPYGQDCSYCGNSCTFETVPAFFCGDGNLNQPFEACDTTVTQSVTCDPTNLYFYYDRDCVLEQTAANLACTWGAFSECTQRGSCGDGILNGPEICDDNLAPPGLCQQCLIADNKASVTYTMTTAGKDYVFPLSEGVLPLNMKVETITRYEVGCGYKTRDLFYQGNLTSHWVALLWQGQNCDWFDAATMTSSHGGALADETSLGPGGGGEMVGQLFFTGQGEVRTSDKIKILERINESRRWVAGGVLPAGTWTLSVESTGNVLVWLAADRYTTPSNGTTSTTNVNSYILGCVDQDGNNQCDFEQEV